MREMLLWILKGLVAGLVAAGLLATVARGTSGHDWGFATLTVGILTGGLVMLLALGMSGLSYYLAVRGQAATLRRRLLSSAIFCGAAGLGCGVSAVLLWALSGVTP